MSNTLGLDTEFAIPIKEYATGKGISVRTMFENSCAGLTHSFFGYAKQDGKKEGMKTAMRCMSICNRSAEALSESELVTEVYYPVKKRFQSPNAADM